VIQTFEQVDRIVRGHALQGLGRGVLVHVLEGFMGVVFLHLLERVGGRFGRKGFKHLDRVGRIE
jgi:hypothetical protein